MQKRLIGQSEQNRNLAADWSGCPGQVCTSQPPLLRDLRSQRGGFSSPGFLCCRANTRTVTDAQRTVASAEAAEMRLRWK